MIEFINVTKSFRNDFWSPKFKALDEVSFRINEGDLVGFLGANGAGKTTSIKILMQFIQKDSGEIRYGDGFGKSFRDFLSNVGYLPERPYFYPHLTGREFVSYMASLNKVPNKLLKERCNKLAEQFMIDHALDRKIRGYSKGMLQRIGFVSALIHDPKLIILDEPVAGLDPVGRREIKDALLDLHKEGKTVFFSSHIVSDVEEICNSVIVLQKGKLLYQGSIDSLIEENIGPNCHIRCQTPSNISLEAYDVISSSRKDDSVYLEVENSKRDKLLVDIIQQGGAILGVEQKQPTLEQIVYQIRGN